VGATLRQGEPDPSLRGLSQLSCAAQREPWIPLLIVTPTKRQFVTTATAPLQPLLGMLA
jgi:hypothetical protein